MTCYFNLGTSLMSCVLWCGQVAAYVEHCGALTQYGMRHTRLMANMCNAGLGPADITRAAHQACTGGMRPTTSAVKVAWKGRRRWRRKGMVAPGMPRLYV